MNNNELLLAISDMLDEKLNLAFDDKLNTVLDAHDKKLTKTFDDKLEALDKKLTKTFDDKLTPIYTRLDSLEQRVLKIQITQENDILPRLQTIEDCYLSTYKRYEESCDKIDQMQKDIEIHSLVLEEHSEILKRIS